MKTPLSITAILVLVRAYVAIRDGVPSDERPILTGPREAEAALELIRNDYGFVTMNLGEGPGQVFLPSKRGNELASVIAANMSQSLDA